MENANRAKQLTKKKNRGNGENNGENEGCRNVNKSDTHVNKSDQISKK